MNEAQTRIHRREFLKRTGRMISAAALAMGELDLLGGASAFAAPQSSDDDQYDFLMPRVKVIPVPLPGYRADKSGWAIYPGADRNLLQALSKEIRCKVKIPPNCNEMVPTYGTEEHFNAILDLTDMKELRRFPFLFFTLEHPFVMTETQKQNLKQYLLEGGFMLMDECVFAELGDFFYKCCYELLEEMFGSGSVKRIPLGHEIFHNVYDFNNGVPFVLGTRHGARGLFIGERLAIFLCPTDLHCGWSAFKGEKRQHSIAMGINVVMYSISH